MNWLRKGNTRDNNIVDDTNYLFFGIIVVELIGSAMLLGIAFLIGQSNPTYNDGKFNLKVTEDVERYVSSKDVTTYPFELLMELNEYKK